MKRKPHQNNTQLMSCWIVFTYVYIKFVPKYRENMQIDMKCDTIIRWQIDTQIAYSSAKWYSFVRSYDDQSVSTITKVPISVTPRHKINTVSNIIEDNSMKQTLKDMMQELFNNNDRPWE